MRLAQLARQINVKTFTVREQLSEKFEINFEKGPNTKLDDEHVLYIREFFEPAQPIEIVDSEEVQEINEVVTAEEHVEVPVDDIIEEPKPIEPPLPEKEPVIQSVGEVIGEKNKSAGLPTEEEAELIKAPRVKLEGLKIIDKIDLPEPKIKEPKEEGEEVPVVQRAQSRPDRPKHKATSKNRKDIKRNTGSKKKEKEPVNRGPSMKELQQQKIDKSYKPKTKQVKGKKKKIIKKKAAQPAPEVSEIIEITNPKKTSIGKFWWWLTNG